MTTKDYDLYENYEDHIALQRKGKVLVYTHESIAATNSAVIFYELINKTDRLRSKTASFIRKYRVKDSPQKVCILQGLTSYMGSPLTFLVFYDIEMAIGFAEFLKGGEVNEEFIERVKNKLKYEWLEYHKQLQKSSKQCTEIKPGTPLDTPPQNQAQAQVDQQIAKAIDVSQEKDLVIYDAIKGQFLNALENFYAGEKRLRDAIKLLNILRDRTEKQTLKGKGATRDEMLRRLRELEKVIKEPD